MNIGKYALKSFQRSAGKSVASMIALSFMLLCAVLNIAFSLQKTIFEDAVSIAGDAHCKFANVTAEQVSLLSSHIAVEWAETQLTFTPLVIVCLVYGLVPYGITRFAIRSLLENTTVTLLGQET